MAIYIYMPTDNRIFNFTYVWRVFFSTVLYSSTSVLRWCWKFSMSKWSFATPVVKQSFVTAGVAMNMAGVALVMAYTAGMLPQLRRPDSEIHVEESMESWIAAMPGMSLLLGNFMVPTLMSRLGRKTCNMISIIIVNIGWLCIILAKSVTVILIGRFIQGFSMGAILNLGPILIAEYTSPKNRGAFLMTISVLCGLYVLFIHVVGSILHWHTNSIICMAVAITNLPIVVFSPESPIWLADKERYEESKKAFRYLRGDNEEEELQAIIKASIIANKVKADKIASKTFVGNCRNKLSELKNTITAKEFYKPIFIMIHLYSLGQWGGINIMSTYIIDVIDIVIGKGNNTALHVGVLDIQRIVTNIVAIYIIKKIKRRTMLFSLVALNIFAFLLLAAYVYAKSRDIFESSILGIALLHVLIFSIASGSLPLPLIIAGEIFPLKFKGVGGGISITAYAVNSFLNIKTLPYLFKSISMPGTFVLYAVILAYCLLIAYLFLPETKDRTLQDIEEEFKVEDKLVSSDDLNTVQSLMES